MQAELERHEDSSKTRAGSSHVIRPLLDMLLRRGWEAPVRDDWRKYTHCSQAEFVPAAPEDIFAWRNTDGINASSFPQPADSITHLRQEARDRNQREPFLAPFAELLGLHLIVFPFRATPAIIGALDQPISQPTA